MPNWLHIGPPRCRRLRRLAARGWRCSAERRASGDRYDAGPDVGHHGPVIVNLRHPNRAIELPGPMSVVKLLNRLELNRESVLLVRNGTLVPGDAMLDDDDVIEIRPVISGGFA